MTMVNALRVRGACVWRACSGLSVVFALVFSAATPPEAKANFIGAYQLSNFSLVNSPDADGFAATPDGGISLILTGPNTGSSFSGTTDLTISARAAGLVHFSYQYSSLDTPGFDASGYILGADFFPLADLDGQSGDVSFPVLFGTTFGFRISTLDNLGEPGVLTLRDFTAPLGAEVPEPQTLILLLTAAAVLALRKLISLRRASPVAAQSLRHFLTVAAVAATVSAPLMAQGQVSYAGQQVTGQLALARVVNLRQQVAQQRTLSFATVLPETKPKSPPKRLRPPMSASMSTIALSSTLQTTQPALSLTVAGSQGAFGFPGLSHRDQREANGGNQWSVEPPNLNIAVANGYVLEGVNNAVHVYDLTGAPALPMVLAGNQVFGLAPAIDRITNVNGPYLTDMRVFYDQGMDRWFIIQRGQDNDWLGNALNQSHLYLAVSRTADPTGDYNIYIMDTTNAQNPGCPCIDDYPQIGSDQHGFHIAWNEFNTYTENFVDAAILSVSKTALSAGVGAPTAYRFLIPLSTGYEFAIQPATTPPGATNFLGSGGLAYFVSSRATYASGDRVALWAMTNTSSLATQTPNPALLRIVVPTLVYSYPPTATQRAGPLPYGSSLFPAGQLPLLDGGDSRIQSVSYAGGRLFLTMQSAVQDAQGAYVAGGAYVVMTPTYRGGVVNATVINQGYLFVNGNHLLRPSLAVNAQGRGAVAATLVGPNWYPSAAYIPFEAFAAPSLLNVAGLGTLPEDGFTGYPGGYGVGIARWGDYNSAVAASDGSIWMAAQFVGSYPRSEFANWNTFIIRKQP